MRCALRIGGRSAFSFFVASAGGARAHFQEENSLFSFPKYFFNRLRDMGI